MSKHVDDIVVIGGARTPFSKYGGVLKEWASSDLGAYLMPRALEKAKIPAEKLDYFVCASSLQAEVAAQGNTVARQVIIKAGLPLSLPSISCDQASCSGLTAIALAHRIMKAGGGSLVAVLGIEAMSNTPFILPSALRWGVRREFAARDPIFPICSSARPQGAIAEVDDEAKLFNVTRDDMDVWAYETQMRFEKARARGFFKDEMIPVELKDGTLMEEDDTPKPWSTLEKLRSLKTVFGSNSVTAGNSPGLETGAAVVFLATRKKAEELGLAPLATIVDVSLVAGDLESPLSQGAKAAKKLLENNGIAIEQIDMIEAEEDFAAVVPITEQYFAAELGADPKDLRSKINPNGGAVAVGHPIATGGVRILYNLVRELREENKKLGLATISGGLSQGVAALVKIE